MGNLSFIKHDKSITLNGSIVIAHELPLDRITLNLNLNNNGIYDYYILGGIIKNCHFYLLGSSETEKPQSNSDSYIAEILRIVLPILGSILLIFALWKWCKFRASNITPQNAHRSISSSTIRNADAGSYTRHSNSTISTIESSMSSRIPI
jgi:hypothetical protein